MSPDDIAGALGCGARSPGVVLEALDVIHIVAVAAAPLWRPCLRGVRAIEVLLLLLLLLAVQIFLELLEEPLDGLFLFAWIESEGDAIRLVRHEDRFPSDLEGHDGIRALRQARGATFPNLAAIDGPPNLLQDAHRRVPLDPRPGPHAKRHLEPASVRCRLEVEAEELDIISASSCDVLDVLEVGGPSKQRHGHVIEARLCSRVKGGMTPDGLRLSVKWLHTKFGGFFERV